MGPRGDPVDDGNVLLVDLDQGAEVLEGRRADQPGRVVDVVDHLAGVLISREVQHQAVELLVGRHELRFFVRHGRLTERFRHGLQLGDLFVARTGGRLARRGDLQRDAHREDLRQILWAGQLQPETAITLELDHAGLFQAQQRVTRGTVGDTELGGNCRWHVAGNTLVVPGEERRLTRRGPTNLTPGLFDH
jgi:hypothetical protein